jgi:hypothetical protein
MQQECTCWADGVDAPLGITCAWLFEKITAQRNNVTPVLNMLTDFIFKIQL